MEVQLSAVVDRYRKLGLTGQARTKEGDEKTILLHPYCVPPSEVDINVDYGVVPALRTPGKSRMEELLALCTAEQIPHKGPADIQARTLTFTASDETRDRYGDRILVDGQFMRKSYGVGWLLDEYKRNPVFLPFHQSREMPVGIALDTWTEKKGTRKRLRQAVLFSDGEANPLSPRMLAAYKSRLMRAVSVGFMPHKIYEPSNDQERSAWGLGKYGLLFGEQELWEDSAVSIPANPNALQESIDARDWMAVERFADQVKDVAPEFSLLMRDVLDKGRASVQLVSAPDVVEEPPLTDGDEGVRSATAASDPNMTALVASLGALCERMDGMIGRLDKLVEATRVATTREAPLGKGGDKPQPDSEDGGDLFDQLLSTTRSFSEAARTKETP